MTDTMLRLVIKARDEASGVLRGVGKESGALGKAMKGAQIGAAVGLAAIAGIIGKGVKSYEDLGGAVAQLSRLTKISSEDASRFVGQWGRFGVDSKTGTKSLIMMSKQIGAAAGGSKKSVSSFQQLGISMADLRKMTPAQVMAKARDALSAMGPTAQRTTLMMQLFGKGGQSMLKWLAATPASIEDVNKILTDTGQIMSGPQLVAYKKTAAEQAKLSLEWKGFLITVGASVLPILGQLVGVLGKVMMVLMPLAPVLKFVALGLAGFLVIGKLVSMIQGAVGAFRLLNLAFLSSPIFWLIAAIVLLVAGFIILWIKCKWFRDFWIGLWNGIKAVFWAVVNGIKAAAVSVFNAIIAFFKAWGVRLLTILGGPVAAVAVLVVKNWDRIRSGAVAVFNAVVSFARSFAGRIKSAVGSLGGLLYGVGRSIVQGLVNGLSGAFNAVVSFAKNVGGRVRNAVGSLGGLLYGVGRSIVQGLINGITYKIREVTDLMGSLAKKIAGFIHFSDGPLGPVGRKLMAGLVSGIGAGVPALQRAMSSVAGTVAGTDMGGPALAGAGGGGRSVIIQAGAVVVHVGGDSSITPAAVTQAVTPALHALAREIMAR